MFIKNCIILKIVYFYVSKYIVGIYNRRYKVEIFASDNIRYRNKQRIY